KIERVENACFIERRTELVPLRYARNSVPCQLEGHAPLIVVENATMRRCVAPADVGHARDEGTSELSELVALRRLRSARLVAVYRVEKRIELRGAEVEQRFRAVLDEYTRHRAVNRVARDCERRRVLGASLASIELTYR